MPNWASTKYAFHSTKEDVQDLKKKIDELNAMNEPYVKNGFGKLRLGCLVNYLGGDYDKVCCRGEIISYKFHNDEALSLCCETAWGETPEFRHFLESKYPGSKIYYQVEESGCLVYGTNDKEGKYFPERYMLDYYDGCDYFYNIDEAAEFIGKYLLDMELEHTVEAIEKAIDDWLEEHDDEKDWMSFHKFDVEDD